MSIVARRLLVTTQVAFPGRTKNMSTAKRLADVGAATTELILRPNPSGEFTDLTCVNMMCEHVGGSCVCKLAKSLSKAPGLERLDLRGNKLGALPDAVKDLEKLTYLDVSGNELKELSSIAKLPNLKTLVADDNKLTRLELGDMTSLRQISLNNNAMTSFPDLSWETLCAFDFKIQLDGNPCHPDNKPE